MRDSSSLKMIPWLSKKGAIIKFAPVNENGEVEIDEIEQLEPAISSGVDAVLLDNFSPTLIKQAMMKNKNRVVIEAK